MRKITLDSLWQPKVQAQKYFLSIVSPKQELKTMNNNLWSHCDIVIP